VRSASHRGGFHPAHHAGGAGREDSRIATSRGRRQGVSGAAAAGDGSRTDPVPCGTTCPYGPTDLPPTEGRISWRAVNSLTRRWSAKILHGCWRGRPPTTVMQLSKNRSVRRLQRPWRLHRIGGLIGRPGRWSPGLYPVPTDPPAPPCKFLGSPGGCQEGPTPGGLPPLPHTGLSTRGGSSGRAVGFPCHYWQRECLAQDTGPADDTAFTG